MPRKPRGEALGGRLWAESRAERDAGRDAAVREGKRRQEKAARGAEEAKEPRRWGRQRCCSEREPGITGGVRIGRWQ